MGVISGESPRSSRASSNFGDGRDSPVSRHSSSDSTSSRKGQPRLQYQQHAENTNDPYGHLARARNSASPASSQEGISNSRYLAAPGTHHRRSSRPSSVYSSTSDLRGGSSPRQRAVSAHSFESRTSYTDLAHMQLPHMQPPPPLLTGNSHLKEVIGSNASLLSTKQTLEMYRANAKKTNDPGLQYELAVFMVSAAQQQEILASEGGRAPKRDLDSPYVDTSAAQSKAELLKEAKGILERLANKLPQAQYYLADAYASGLFNNGKPENDKAFPLFVAASKHGHAEAGYRAALCYEFGWGCRADPLKSVQFYRQSASKNHPGAMTRLGKACLRDDLGLSGRYKEGVKWLKRATDVADYQYPNAPYELGLLHETGYGDDIFQDPSYAAQLFTKAAELGHVDAYYRMGDAYEHGKLNCPRDAALSVHFYTGAAQKGHPLAMMALCAWYMVGAEPVLEKNEDEAYQWALKAAETGLAKAEYAVGYFTEMGIGCRRDPLEANVWYVKAADHGDKRAKDRLAVIHAAAAGPSTDKKSKKKGKDKDGPNKLESRRGSGDKDKECRIM
ncbi:hypothetical protein BDZ91DRAFT_761742 [Kalaharituber pfeilii]|nr:hypothetical protein BDZ91DRAFT_761742 [Kalaharituber pfeilii]